MAEGLDLSKIRNIGLAAHIDAGKTTTTERILFYSGRVHRMGEVDAGDATMDWMPQEMERGITITSAATTCEWGEHRINIIDTPGHVDFTAEVERSLRVLDGLIAVVCAVGGVQPQTETVWRQADKYHIPRLVFINKLDRLGANFHDVLHQMRSRLGASVVALQIPIMTGDRFEGVVDLLSMQALRWTDELGEQYEYFDIPDSMYQVVQSFHDHLLVTVAECDEALTEQYLGGEPLDLADVRRALRRATLQGELLPVLCGTSLKNRGIQPLLDAVVDYLPAPSDVAGVEGVHPTSGEAERREPNPQAPAAGLVFKVVTDPFVGRLCYVRVYSGQLVRGKTLLNVSSNRRERLGRLLRMHANRREDVEEVLAGDIVAVVGLNSATTGDTLCDAAHPILLEKISFPKPVIAMAIEPKNKAEADKLDEALGRLAAEDPTFEVRTDSQTGQQIIAGMGELHLEIIHDRLQREFGVHPTVGKPQVAYKETITASAQAEGRHVKQTGGRGQYGHVVLRLEPIPPETGIEFASQLRGGAISKEFLPAIESGMREAAGAGSLGGYPVEGVRVTLLDGSEHEVDSSDLAFKIAAAIGFREAYQRAQPILLEPIMAVEIITPENYLGDVVQDLGSRSAEIASIAAGPAQTQIVHARVPLARMFGYSTALRNLSQGRATYTMQPHSYQPAAAPTGAHSG